MDAFSQFLQQVREQVEAYAELPEQLVCNVSSLLDTLINNEQLDLHSHADPGAHFGELLYEDARTGFVAALIAWGPGASTTIHGHDSWDVFGVLKGSIEVTNYIRKPTEGFSPISQFDARPGDVTYLLPPDQSVHKICNPNDELALSLHVYGQESDFFVGSDDEDSPIL